MGCRPRQRAQGQMVDPMSSTTTLVDEITQAQRHCGRGLAAVWRALAGGRDGQLMINGSGEDGDERVNKTHANTHTQTRTDRHTWTDTHTHTHRRTDTHTDAHTNTPG